MNFSKKKLQFSLIINLFFTFTIIIFAPYEIFISNTNDFAFTFLDFWWMPVIAGIVYTIIASFILSHLPEKEFEICNLLLFSLTLCCYIQAMFLNSQMKVLIGEEIHWKPSVLVSNTIIWLFIFVSVFLLWHFGKSIWKNIIQFTAVSLVIMQFVALIFLFLTTDILSEEKNGYISTEGMLELSSRQNVVVFILDYFDERTMNSILEKDPDFLSPLEGFTYFPNATSVHSRTYPSITYLLTGNICHFDQKPLTYVNSSYDNSNFLPVLNNNNIDVGLYTFDYYLGSNAKKQICNYVASKPSLKFVNTVKYLFKMALYRDMPYVIKERFYYDVNDINNNVTSNERILSASETAQAETMIPAYKNFDDEWFYDTLTSEKLRTSDIEGAFRFYHLGSCHLNLTDPEPYGIRSFEIVYNYLQQMQDLGLYQDATIIITADHGSSGGGDTLDLPQQTAVPLFLVKPAGETGPLKISNAPVSHTDFIPTVLSGFSLDYNDHGTTVFDIFENEPRDRYYYYSALYTNEEGEIELREYKVSGDARKPESYTFTGNKWDIIYSANIVADRG